MNCPRCGSPEGSSLRFRDLLGLTALVAPLIFLQPIVGFLVAVDWWTVAERLAWVALSAICGGIGLLLARDH